jgi:phosphatidylserine/phosphatidylglycerophosphate/cardiolipin synthase-like enzyme
LKGRGGVKIIKRTAFLLAIISIVLSACGVPATASPPPSGTPPTPLSPASDPETIIPTLEVIPLPVGYGVDGGWFALYFTDPQNPLSDQRTGGIDAPLVAAIDSARLTLDIAIYSIGLRSIRDALIRAHKRGVQVRMVMESDNMDRSAPQRLKEEGIPILGDRREGLMHNKFVIIDGYEVWTGSANFTATGLYADNNLLLRIRSVKVVENFAKEFDEMFVDDKFGDNIAAETPNPQVTVEGTEIETYFSPDDGVSARIVELVNGAQHSIYFMAFSFTSDPIGEAIRARARTGVTVAGVMDDEQVRSNIGTEFDPFRQAGLDVYRDGNPGQMHHKVIIIDERTVILGSYNFSAAAEIRNDETMLVIHNEQFAAQFVEEFRRVYAQAK